MALGHAGIFLGGILPAQQVGPEEAVAQVMLLSVAFDGGGVAKEDADVVEHRGGFNLPGGDGQLFLPGYGEGLVGYLPAMGANIYPEGGCLRDNICR